MKNLQLSEQVLFASIKNEYEQASLLKKDDEKLQALKKLYTKLKETLESQEVSFDLKQQIKETPPFLWQVLIDIISLETDSKVKAEYQQTFLELMQNLSFFEVRMLIDKTRDGYHSGGYHYAQKIREMYPEDSVDYLLWDMRLIYGESSTFANKLFIYESFCRELDHTFIENNAATVFILYTDLWPINLYTAASCALQCMDISPHYSPDDLLSLVAKKESEVQKLLQFWDRLGSLSAKKRLYYLNKILAVESIEESVKKIVKEAINNIATKEGLSIDDKKEDMQKIVALLGVEKTEESQQIFEELMHKLSFLEVKRQLNNNRYLIKKIGDRYEKDSIDYLVWDMEYGPGSDYMTRLLTLDEGYIDYKYVWKNPAAFFVLFNDAELRYKYDYQQYDKKKKQVLNYQERTWRNFVTSSGFYSYSVIIDLLVVLPLEVKKLLAVWDKMGDLSADQRLVYLKMFLDSHYIGETTSVPAIVNNAIAKIYHYEKSDLETALYYYKQVAKDADKDEYINALYEMVTIYNDYVAFSDPEAALRITKEKLTELQELLKETKDVRKETVNKLLATCTKRLEELATDQRLAFLKELLKSKHANEFAQTIVSNEIESVYHNDDPSIRDNIIVEQTTQNNEYIDVLFEMATIYNEYKNASPAILESERECLVLLQEALKDTKDDRKGQVDKMLQVCTEKQKRLQRCFVQGEDYIAKAVEQYRQYLEILGFGSIDEFLSKKELDGNEELLTIRSFLLSVRRELIVPKKELENLEKPYKVAGSLGKFSSVIMGEVPPQSPKNSEDELVHLMERKSM